MGRRKIALSLSALLFMACPVFADSEPNCENPVAQQEMNICANRDFEKADAALNAVWKLARKSAEDEDEGLEGNLKGSAAALLAAQRGWLAYRDGSCELAGFEARGGSMEPMLVAGCLAEMTRARTKELQGFVNGPEQ